MLSSVTVDPPVQVYWHGSIYTIAIEIWSVDLLDDLDTSLPYLTDIQVKRKRFPLQVKQTRNSMSAIYRDFYNPHMTIMTIMVTILVTILSILVRIITRGGQRHMIFLIFYGTQVATTF